MISEILSFEYLLLMFVLIFVKNNTSEQINSYYCFTNIHIIINLITLEYLYKFQTQVDNISNIHIKK